MFDTSGGNDFIAQTEYGAYLSTNKSLYGITYWNEVICKADRARYMYPVVLNIVGCLCCWFAFHFYFFSLFSSLLFSCMFVTEFRLLNNPNDKTRSNILCRVKCAQDICLLLIPLCEALAAFTINPSCIECIANTIDNNRKKQFLFIFSQIIVCSSLQREKNTTTTTKINKHKMEFASCRILFHIYINTGEIPRM